MTNASPGWYDDGSGRQRWWDGSVWSDRFLDEYAQADKASPSTSTLKGLSPAKFAVIAFSAAILLIAVAAGGWPTLLFLLGVGLVTVGVVAIARGSLPWLRIRSRPTGILLLIVGLVAFSGGAGAAASTTQSALDHTVVTTSSPAQEPTRTTKPTPTPVREVREVEEKSVVPYTSSTVDDPNLAAGTTATTTTGVNGEKVTTYEVTFEDGVEVSRRVVGETVSIPVVNEVISNGTYVAPPPPPPPPAAAVEDCDPNYADACVPVASDVDCAGGSGNGPAYVQGPVRIVGTDIYDLDRDGDGIACDR